MFSSHSYEMRDVPKPARSRLFSQLGYSRGVSVQVAGLMINQDMRILVSEKWSRRHAAGRIALAAKERFRYIKKEGLDNLVGVAWLESRAEPDHQQALHCGLNQSSLTTKSRQGVGCFQSSPVSIPSAPHCGLHASFDSFLTGRYTV